MTYQKTNKSAKAELNADAESAKKSALGFLEFLDTLPNPPRPRQAPFPYGNDKATPYGWFLK